MTKIFVAVLAGAVALPTLASAADPKADAAKIDRGRYLVLTGGCHDCHSPKKMGAHGPEVDESRMLSGHPEGSDLPEPPALPKGPWIAVGAWDLTAWSGPWGVTYAFNLTPDQDTGIGAWTEEMFTGALKTGRHMGQSRPILPPMPIESTKHLTNEDLSAMYAYLRTIPPVKNRVPEARIAEPPSPQK